MSISRVLPGLRVSSLETLSVAERERIMRREPTNGKPASRNVRRETIAIIDAVRERGDEALRDFARGFDGVSLDSLEIPHADWEQALSRIEPGIRAAMERAARNIAIVHEAQRPHETEVSPEPGITIGRRPDPLTRVGVYAPGGRAAYPSSLLMGVVPARVAGVTEVIVCSPPGADGKPSDVVLAAACIAGADRVFAAGGAGAIAAMAIGTASIPRVDRIVGPGNAYVAEAKLLLVDQVAIDAPAGPSELLILATDGADPERLVAEMFAQAEHDPDAAVVAVIAGGEAEVAATRLSVLLSERMEAADRAGIIRESLTERGAILHTSSTERAIAFSNEWAPEHLLLCANSTEQEESWLGQTLNAGTVFLGAGASVAFGDYMTGSNHVLPTAGLARAYSGLSVLDFVRWTTWQRIDSAAAASMSGDTAIFAESEGLGAHAAAARFAAGVKDV